MRFLNVVLGAVAVTSAVAAPTTTTTRNAGVEKRKSKFLFTGVNESGAEFGQGNLPGTLGTDYTWPVHSTIDVREEISISCGSGTRTNYTHRKPVDLDRKGLQHLPGANFDVRYLRRSLMRIQSHGLTMLQGADHPEHLDRQHQRGILQRLERCQ
jgi:hypothetical protein